MFEKRKGGMLMDKKALYKLSYGIGSEPNCNI